MEFLEECKFEILYRSGAKNNQQISFLETPENKENRMNRTREVLLVQLLVMKISKVSTV